MIHRFGEFGQQPEPNSIITYFEKAAIDVVKTTLDDHVHTWTSLSSAASYLEKDPKSGSDYALSTKRGCVTLHWHHGCPGIPANRRCS
ncbi:hypothetical protein LSH36_573g05003 [Paralvinella palmiformis]|uniref:Uncharacterized protein n=1 Tax=Paralvinella palmiformis TaxID=53620 RepID=A0AAD9J5X5_9ANNE|nr:hypothetical protein LSH36_573g05003 [Paralvinella palmiformis]